MTDQCCESFYRLVQDDARFPDQWYLDEPLTLGGEPIDAERFTEGEFYAGTSPATVPIYNPGRPLAISFAPMEMAIVSQQVMDLLSPLVGGDVQWLPVSIAGIPEQYAILNTLVTLDCLDEQRSEFTRWTADDYRPDLIGEYRMISTMRIDSRRAAGHAIFRLKGWPLALLVSARVKDALRTVADLGVIFEPVT